MYSDSQVLANNLNKRFAINKTENAYNTISDFPTTGSGFGVNTKNLTLYTGFVIPAYSRICFMNYMDSPDAAISAVSPGGDIYSAFRNGGVWQNGKISASKDDLGVFLTNTGTKAAVYKSEIGITSLNLSAGHTYLVLGSTQVDASVSLMSARLSNPSAEYGNAFELSQMRTDGSNGGGCMTASIMSLTKDFTVSVRGYGYDNSAYNYIGYLIAVRLK